MVQIEKILDEAIKRDASDVHLITSSYRYRGFKWRRYDRNIWLFHKR